MSQNSHEPGPVTDKLEIHCRQQLSALIDGELPADEARFLLRRLEHDQELAGCLDRWQLTGELLRHQVQVMAPMDFSQRVSAAIAAEAKIEPPHAAQGGRSVWIKWGGGAALAASVVAVALLVNWEKTPSADTPEAPVFAVQAQLPAADSPHAARPASSGGAVAATVAENPPLAEPSAVPIAGKTVMGGLASVPSRMSSSEVAASVSTTRRPARQRAVTPRVATSSGVAVMPVAALPPDQPKPDSAATVPAAATVASSISTSSAESADSSPSSSPRPWPRSSLLPSSRTFNTGFPRSSTLSDFPTFDSSVRPESLFPPAMDQPAVDITTSQD